MQPGFEPYGPLPQSILGPQPIDEFHLAGTGTPRPETAPASASREAADQSGGQRPVQRLDERLTAALRGLVQGLACDAADFYLLSAASNELVLRTAYREGEGESGDTHRPLTTARADVTAMAGNAVVLEDDVEVAGWPVPLWCGAAVCLPVASDQTIHGTLWLYQSEPRAFTDAEVGLAEVVAGRLAVELELDTWRTAAAGGNDPAPSPATDPAPHPSGATRPAAKARVARPSALPLEEWELAGWVTPADTHAFFDWQTLPDGRTLVATGALADSDDSLSGWLHAARIALRAHALRAADAGELLTLANHTLWLASPGGEGLAVAAAMLEPDGTRASVAMAGDAGIVRWRSAVCDFAGATSPALGWSERSIYSPRTVDLVVRERLVLATFASAVPTTRDIDAMGSKLRTPSPNELRSMCGKRALRLMAEACDTANLAPAGLALVRRR